MIKRILVGLGDVPYSQSATLYALELAERHGAQLTAVTLVDPDRLHPGPVPIGGGDAARELYEYRLRLTEEIVEGSVELFTRACKDRGANFHVLREAGNPFERMVSCAKYHDVIVCGLKNLFDHGVVDEPPYELIKLVENGVRPIVAVPPEYRPIHAALIAFSGSSESAKTMRLFTQMSLWPDLVLRVVTFDRDQPRGQERLESARGYLEAHGMTATFDNVAGSPSEGLLPYAEQHHCDLVVMGNSAKKFYLKRLFGETILHAVSHADRPLFLCQ